jgi:hypothetical protein
MCWEYWRRKIVHTYTSSMPKKAFYWQKFHHKCAVCKTRYENRNDTTFLRPNCKVSQCCYICCKEYYTKLQLCKSQPQVMNGALNIYTYTSTCGGTDLTRIFPDNFINICWVILKIQFSSHKHVIRCYRVDVKTSKRQSHTQFHWTLELLPWWVNILEIGITVIQLIRQQDMNTLQLLKNVHI